jgi:RecA-family ATPase
MYRHKYTDIKTHIHPDGQTYRWIDRQIQRDKQPISRKTGRHVDRNYTRRTTGQKDS